jgi:DUF2946 family protein
MLRNPTLQRTMTRLALVAVLLMVSAPTVGRWMKGDRLEFLPGLTEICTTLGLQSVDTSAWGTDAAQTPAPGHDGMDVDCAYCPLLAGTALLLLAFILLRPEPGAAGISSALVAVFRGSSTFPGLGSRGPPLFL